MHYKDIRLEAQHGIAKITLNRPEKMNALSANLVLELKEAIQSVADRSEYQVVIVTGAGKAFSAGADLQGFADQGQNPDGDQTILEAGIDLMKTMQTMSQVSIAMVNGYCFTGALELLLAFDLIFASSQAQFGDTHCKWGLYPQWGMSQRLPAKVGMLKARELSYTAKAIDAHEAKFMRLVNQVFPHEALETCVWEVAQQIQANSAQTVAAMKELYHYGSHHTLRAGIQYELEAEYQIKDRQQFLADFKKNKQS